MGKHTTSPAVPVVVSAFKLWKAVEELMEDDDLLAVTLKDRQHRRDAVLRIEKSLNAGPDSWDKPTELWLRIEQRDLAEKPFAKSSEGNQERADEAAQ